MRFAPLETFQLRPLQSLGDARGDFGFRHTPHLQPEADVLGHGEVWKKQRFLKDHRSAAAFRRDRHHGCAVKHHVAAPWREQSGDGF
jgi:hypothetical protein